jgi:hypothetical protein
MWILNFLPDAVFYAMLLIGVLGIVASFVLGFLPFVSKYKLPIQVASILLTVVGVWYAGGIAKDKEYRAALEAANARATLAEAKAAAATAKVEYVFLDRVKTVKDVQVVVQERIRDISVKIDEQCRVVPEVIDIHNQAARNKAGAAK